MDLRERKHGLRSTSWDDGHGKPVESCLALHEMDLKPFSRNCGQAPPKRARRSINWTVRYAAILLDKMDEAHADFDEIIIERNLNIYWLHFAVRQSGNRRKVTMIVKR